MALHRLRCGVGFRHRLAHVPPEREVRRTRADEAGRGTDAPPPCAPPQTGVQSVKTKSRFPLLSVEHGCIVSKDADITAAFEVELPEVYTVTAEEYEAIHATWCKAIKVLPDYSVLHKQDWYVKERYRPDTGRELLGAAQAGLVREGAVPPRHRQGRHGLPRPQLRDALQRKTFPPSQVLPVPDQDDEGAHEAAEQLEHPVPGAHRAEGDAGQGNGGEVHRGGG